MEHIRDLRLEFLAKIHFLEKGDRKSLGKLIEGQQEVCRDRCVPNDRWETFGLIRH